MAMEVGARGGPIARINVTPMADVMIVLLIIFMVTVPILGREVDPPAASEARAVAQAGRLTITLRADGLPRIDGRVVLPVDLPGAVRERLEARADAAAVYVQADESLSYEQVDGVISALRAAGAVEVALAAEPEAGR